MGRYFFEIAYNGKNYSGWQSQKNALGVQEVLEKCLTNLLGTRTEIVGSGRTDAGVHCEQQFFHVDTNGEVLGDDFMFRLNSFLPKDIVIRQIFEVKPEVSARYDAQERAYRYEITRVKNPFLIESAWHFFKDVDVQTMNSAAALLIGEHDFECFSKVKTDVNHFRCDVKSAGWEEVGDKLIFRISANRFLRGMVRSIVGTLLDVGSGKTSIEDFKRVLESKDRKKAGANAPAYGLYFASVKYRDDIYLTKY